MGGFQKLISLPPAMAEFFPSTEAGKGWFAACDPPGGKLGSGGGVAHLLASAWRAGGGGLPFAEWCASGHKLALMSGGQSRRLPAYAATGKILMPFPALRWGEGQRLDQTLLDVQFPGFRQIATAAPESSRVFVASGDVLLRFPQGLPPVPDADVVGLGMWVDAETASHFGVFFSRRESPADLAFFLQKPQAAEIQRLAADHLFLVDTGLWLLGPRAAAALFRKCGWDETRQDFPGGIPLPYELYAGMGPCLGKHPAVADAEISGLSCAVVPVPGAEFYHFGTSRQMVESVSALQNRTLDQRGQSPLALKPHPEMHVLNSSFAFARRSPANKPLWIENCALPAEMGVSSGNVLTNIPKGTPAFRLAPGMCVDTPPVGDQGFAVRVYGIDDPFQGAVESESTLWLGEPAAQWFARRGLSMADAGIPNGTDIQNARLFPVVQSTGELSRLAEWMGLPDPPADPGARALWLQSGRLSAQGIAERFSPSRLFAARLQLISEAAPLLHAHRARNAFHRLDLDHAAEFYARVGAPPLPAGGSSEPTLEALGEKMFSARVAALRGDSGLAAELENSAFESLSLAIAEAMASRPCAPVASAVEDQIVWGRSPVRIDLAGGWSDTPPYCLKRGGAVVNAAVELNGQPPVQVFARITSRRALVVRSIDLGAETRIADFSELGDFEKVGGEFSLAKAALCLAGFHPRFGARPKARTLDEMLGEFGGGLEISLLAATPKGSGLGTSSILAATLLGTLSDVCGLGWDPGELTARTLVLEQLLTTGGGWQDQAGGIHRGLKIVETDPGLVQRAAVRWLPEHLLAECIANGTALLYYTGTTRIAKTILRDIVRGMFLGRSRTLSILGDIAAHARNSFEALHRDSWQGLCGVVKTSWELNCALDPGTDPPEIRQILARIADWTAAAKLPGAGGGGYLFILAKDPEAAARIRKELGDRPPNPLARFVKMKISPTGFQVTRS